MGMNDINSLAHTKWNCKYHIVFAPKYRRKVFYQEKREAVGKNSKAAVRMEGSTHSRSGSLSGSHPYAGRNTS